MLNMKHIDEITARSSSQDAEAPTQQVEENYEAMKAKYDCLVRDAEKRKRWL
ncbi:MAG: hypothetical protein V1850_00880 [Candidatus Bathyarchaeota archaeon]